MPRTARLARHGVAAYGVLRPTSDGDLQQTDRTGLTPGSASAASFDRITLSNQGKSGRTRAEPPFWSAADHLVCLRHAAQIGTFCASLWASALAGHGLRR